MGCDIHCFVEIKKATYWDTWNGCNAINPPRCYDMFAAMAGVRDCGRISRICDPRGRPTDCSEEAADYFGEYGVHSESWLTTEEFERAIQNCGGHSSYKALLAAMQSLEADGEIVRLVFAFDS